MNYQSLYDFYWFGTCLRFLQDASEGYIVHGDDYVLGNLNSFFNHLENLNLTVTNRLAQHSLNSLIDELEGTTQDAHLTEEQANKLAKSMSQIRATLEAEILGVGAYIPTPKRLDLERLLNDVSALFSPNVFDTLPDIARFDFAEAGKCIAFERPTAAAFHCLRATESVLRFYYRQMIRQKRGSSQMWGPVVADLRARNITSKYSFLNNHLDNIRVSFRNPTQHPEATYDIHEAQDLWSLCVEVVNKMVKVLREENKLK